MMGNGVYRDLFEGLQLCTLTVWKYGSESGTAPLSGINLGILTRNSFPNSFGAQFICIMCVLTAFWVLLIMVDKIPHDSTAMLIRRKTIIFPVRIYTFFFNILLFTSLVQVATNSPSSNYLAFSLAILALIKLAIVLGGIIVVSNWNNFKIDDPNY